MVPPIFPQPPPRVRAERSRGTRCRGAGSAPPKITPTEPVECVHGGRSAALLSSPRTGRSRCAPTAVAAAPGSPQPSGYPVLIARYLRCVAGSSGWEEAEPSRSGRAEGWPDPQTSDVASSAAQSLGIAREPGVFPAGVLRQERQSPTGSDPGLPLGSSPAVTSPPFPAPVRSDFLRRRSGADGAMPNSHLAYLPSRPSTGGTCEGHKHPTDTTPKAIKSLQRCCSHPPSVRPSVPPSSVQLSKCFMVLIPAALSTGVVLITCTFQRANADHVPLL